jgi:hypothetical protein
LSKLLSSSMKAAVNPSGPSETRRCAKHSFLQHFRSRKFSMTQAPLLPRNPKFPALRSGHRRSPGSSLKSKFLAASPIKKRYIPAFFNRTTT